MKKHHRNRQQGVDTPANAASQTLGDLSDGSCQDNTPPPHKSRAEHSIATAHRTATLCALTDHLESKHEEEKRILARELHDDIGAALTTLSLYSNTLYKASSDQLVLQQTAGKVLEIVRLLAESTRQMQLRLHPNMLDLFGLKAAMTELVDEFAQRTGIVCKLSLPDDDIEFAPAVAKKLEITLYRMLQELLDNVANHAMAKAVTVVLDVGDDEIALTVRDDGVGIADDWQNKTTTFGLHLLCERALFLSGSFSIAANKEGRAGTMARIILPAGW